MRATPTLLAALAVALCASGCTDNPSQAAPGLGGAAGGGAAGSSGGSGATSQYLGELKSWSDYNAVSGEGAEVKYLARVDGVLAPASFDPHACLFQNTSAYPYHLLFLRSLPEYAALSATRYEDLVLRRASRVMWAGALKLFAATEHPRTQQAGVLAFTLYSGSSSGDALRAADVIEVDRRLKQCLGFARDRLVFTPDGDTQLDGFEAMRSELDAASVVAVTPGVLRNGLAAEAYSEGEAYGYLQVHTASTPPAWVSPRSILVIESAPNDLTLVAGLITTNPQSVAGHVNLRLREKGIPNASVPSVFDNGLITGLRESLVRLSVRRANVTIEPAQLADAEAFWSAREPALGEPVADLSVADLRNLGDLAAADSSAFGVKAANLGELHRVLAPDNRVEGFAIPFSAFRTFLEHHGIDALLRRTLADPALRGSASAKRARLLELRAAIRGATLLPEFVAELRAAVAATYGTAGENVRLRFRSSTNVEDLPGLSGAGLYDSASGCLADDFDGDALGPSLCLAPEHELFLLQELELRRAELAQHPERGWLLDVIEDLEDDLLEEKSALGAIRRVWASLWNERAFDDREFYGIQHELAYMGLAVHPSFVGERLEAVALTNLEADGAESLYRVVSQAGELGVAQPVDPAATPEIIQFRRTASGVVSAFERITASSRVADGRPLWDESMLGELAPMLFRVQDHFETVVYPGVRPLSLDIEVDVTHDGRIVPKQARPYQP